MANFKYKTRGNSSPQGKPRVYFCCHHEDFDRYFESVSDEILAKQNCAVWYADEIVVRDEDFFLDLKQMQLFVMPVTTNLLCTENDALDVEFKFAIENHIPVLPLMQESGLEELFNKKCGDLQVLDKHNTDNTAISYDEKLKKHLESVLIGDELAEKIRAAFDAYVFLSYRKKDRRYAQELMQLIHKNEFCRDIAIWYDEFLTPGENFNNSIKEALQKSGLFVLAVTPNLVNELNYIMTTEYPMAKQEGKPILPAELVPTDRKQLFELYKDIPNPTDAHNKAELTEALFESVKKMAIKENDASSEHNFFIGLAYLDGVDVEVNHERALELITSAANDGLLEACGKLVDMYQTGKGVARNYMKAFYWQMKKTLLLEDIANETNSEHDLEKFINNFFISIDLIEETDLRKDREEICLQLISACERLVVINNSVENQRLLMAAYDRMYGYCTETGDEARARFYSQKIVALFGEQLGKYDPESEEAISDNAFLDMILEDIIKSVVNDTESDVEEDDDSDKVDVDTEMLNDIAQSRIEGSEKLADQYESPEAKSILAREYHSIAHDHFYKDDYPVARNYCEKAIEILDGLVTELYKIEHRRSLSECCFLMWKIFAHENDIQTADEFLQKSISIRETMASESGDISFEIELYDFYIDISNSTYRLDADYKKRIETEFCPKQLAAGEGIVEKIGAVEAYKSSVNLAYCYRRMALSYANTSEEEIEYLKKAISISEELSDTFKTERLMHETAELCELLSRKFANCAETCDSQEHYTFALEHLLKSVELKDKLLEINYEKTTADELSRNYKELGKICRRMGRLEDEIQHYYKALDYSDKIPQSDQDNNMLIYRASLYLNLAEAYIEAINKSSSRAEKKMMRDYAKRMFNEGLSIISQCEDSGFIYYSTYFDLFYKQTRILAFAKRRRMLKRTASLLQIFMRYCDDEYLEVLNPMLDLVQHELKYRFGWFEYKNKS